MDRTRWHELGDILVMAICCLLCGGEGFNDMEDFGLAREDWLRTFLMLPNGIPTHDTFNRVFSALDPKAFLDCFLRWTQSLRRAVHEEIVALDGKALRRALTQGSIPCMVKSDRWAQGVTTTERRYFLSSLAFDAPRFARAVRGHWGVENSLHWVLDVQLHEDQCRVRAGYAAENLATLGRLALNMLKKETTRKRGIRGKQKNAGWNHAYLLRLMGI